MDDPNRSAGTVGLAAPLEGNGWKVRSPGEARDWQGAWDTLNARSARSPLLDSRFVATLLDHFGTGRERIAFLNRDGRVVAAAVLTPKRGGLLWRTFQPSQAPVGLWLQDPHLDLVTALDGIGRGLRRPVPLVALSQLDPDLVARPAGSGRLATLDYIETARITLEGTFEEYWAGRGKNLRQNMKKQQNRLSRKGVALAFEAFTDPADMARGVRDYGVLESAGWKSQQGTALEEGNQQGRFYRDLLERFAETGQARCYRLCFGDRLVASDLCISGFGTLVILKTTHDEDCNGYSPGLLLHRQEMPECFAEDGLDVLEFYGKVMDWHRRWASEVRRMYHVNFYAQPAFLLAHRALSKLGSRRA